MSEPLHGTPCGPRGPDAIQRVITKGGLKTSRRWSAAGRPVRAAGAGHRPVLPADAGAAAATGLLASAVVQWLLVRNGVNPWFLAFTGVGSCVVAGLIASMILPGTRKDLKGLTIYTLQSVGSSGDGHSPE